MQRQEQKDTQTEMATPQQGTTQLETGNPVRRRRCDAMNLHQLFVMCSPCVTRVASFFVRNGFLPRFSRLIDEYVLPLLPQEFYLRTTPPSLFYSYS